MPLTCQETFLLSGLRLARAKTMQPCDLIKFFKRIVIFYTENGNQLLYIYQERSAKQNKTRFNCTIKAMAEHQGNFLSADSEVISGTAYRNS